MPSILPSILKALRMAAEPSRARVLLLLAKEELSVAELQEILGAAQSSISTHLAQLKQAGLVEDRRTGKNILYRLARPRGNDGNALSNILNVLNQSAGEIPEAEGDSAALDLVLEKRRDRMRAYFDELAGKFGRQYVPGRSWKGVAEILLGLMPPLVIADLGAGEGTLAQLLARRARKVIAVDSSEKMVEFGQDLARKHGAHNLHYRRGDLESLPLKDTSVDVALFSQSLHHAQHPAAALAEARRILKPGGRVAILDLRKHHFEEAREMYADLWLGFAEAELRQLLTKTGFRNVETSIVHRETEVPYFETLLALADK